MQSLSLLSISLPFERCPPEERPTMRTKPYSRHPGLYITCLAVEGSFYGTIVPVAGCAVPGRGLEPLRISPPDPKSGASANFATLANAKLTNVALLVASGKLRLSASSSSCDKSDNGNRRGHSTRFHPDHYRHAATRPINRTSCKFRFRRSFEAQRYQNGNGRHQENSHSFG